MLLRIVWLSQCQNNSYQMRQTITRRKIPSINREQTFHPDPIYRPFPRPPENLQPNSPGNKPDAKPKIDVEFEENSMHQEGLFLNFIKGLINPIFRN